MKKKWAATFHYNIYATKEVFQSATFNGDFNHCAINFQFIDGDIQII